jgi:uncharacterized protein with von Willebrand factor type A (vWA) domain
MSPAPGSGVTDGPASRGRPPHVDSLVDRVGTLVEQLRHEHLPVTTGAHIDAVAALDHLPLLDLASVRAGLRATLVKQHDPDGVFDRAFAHVFAAAPGEPHGGSGESERSDRPPVPTIGRGEEPSAGSLHDLIADALRRGDEEQLALLAARAVDAFAGLDASGRADRYHLQRVIHAIDLSRMLGAAMRRLRQEGALDELDLVLHRSEISALLEQFRRRIAEEIAARRRYEDRRRSDDRIELQDRELLQLSAADLGQLRRIVQPLARQMAARLRRQRRPHGGGRLDARRTIRRSMQTGGVPIDVVQRRIHPLRPDLVVLCDVSGSVAAFAQFTLMFVTALHAEVRNVRSFAFVDGVAEVTDLFQEARYRLDVNRIVERRGVLGLDGHSDYGRMFEDFLRDHREVLSPRTTVIVCGDARSNYRPAGVEALGRIGELARRVYWLNPEPRHEWDDTDSVIGEYRPLCRAVFEVRTARQLAEAVAALI